MVGIIKRWGQLGYGFVRADGHEVDADMWSHERFVREPGYSTAQATGSSSNHSSGLSIPTRIVADSRARHSGAPHK